MRKPDLSASPCQKCPVQRGEKPRLDLRCIPQLVSLPRPDIKRMLRQIAGVGLLVGKTHGEPEERFIMLADNRFKLLSTVYHAAIGSTESANAQWD